MPKASNDSNNFTYFQCNIFNMKFPAQVTVVLSTLWYHASIPGENHVLYSFMMAD